MVIGYYVVYSVVVEVVIGVEFKSGDSFSGFFDLYGSFLVRYKKLFDIDVSEDLKKYFYMMFFDAKIDSVMEVTDGDLFFFRFIVFVLFYFFLLIEVNLWRFFFSRDVELVWSDVVEFLLCFYIVRQR